MPPLPPSPARVKIEDDRYTCEIWSGQTLEFLQQNLSRFYNELDNWERALPLASLLWDKKPGPNNEYTFDAVAADGRKWSLVVAYDPADAASFPQFTFDVKDFFYETEFVPQRFLRLTALSLTRELGISKIQVTWK